jgi:hypothetical protein
MDRVASKHFNSSHPLPFGQQQIGHAELAGKTRWQRDQPENFADAVAQIDVASV